MIKKILKRLGWIKKGAILVECDMCKSKVDDYYVWHHFGGAYYLCDDCHKIISKKVDHLFKHKEVECGDGKVIKLFGEM